MIRHFLILVLVLASVVFADAQFNIPEINKLKNIRLLESSAFDVQRLLVGFETEGWDPNDYEQLFSTENYSIDTYYSSGKCSEENEIWNSAEWTVTRIEIEPKETLKIKDLGYDFNKFKKEQYYANRPYLVIYYDKEKGFAFKVNDEDGEVEEIILFGPKSSRVNHCDNDQAKQFFTYDSWFGNTKLKDRQPRGDINQPANVMEVTLSDTEIISISFNKQIEVATQAIDPENDVLTFNYTVSAGKIIGSGAKVIWDLQGVVPGTYTITVGVDDGCGICGQTMTKTIVIN